MGGQKIQVWPKTPMARSQCDLSRLAGAGLQISQTFVDLAMIKIDDKKNDKKYRLLMIKIIAYYY